MSLFLPTITIKDGALLKKIGPTERPLIVAEMSGNHNQSLDRALEIIERAAECGADMIKFQTYTADTLTIDCDNEEFIVEADLWKGKTLYQLYEEAHTPWEWHEQMFAKAREVGIIPFSSPFDETAVDFLEELDCPAYKIASFELGHIPLIKKVAATGKPIIFSTGMAGWSDITDAMYAIREYHNKAVLLVCSSTYPARPEYSNIRRIPEYSKGWGVNAGLSDHTPGTTVALGSVALGATLIEKHFTLSRAEGGVDAAFSIEPAELKELVEQSRIVWEALGSGNAYTNGTTIEAEKKNKIFCRSIYVVADIKRGEKLTTDNIRIIRPGLGLKPRNFDKVLGRTVNKDVKRGTPLSMEDLNDNRS